MNPKLRAALAILGGIGVAMVVISLVEMVGARVNPRPAGLDMSDMDAMRAYAASLPASAIAIVLVGWLAGTFVGGFVAALIARRRPLLFSGIVGGVVLLATMINLALLPHPLWLSFSAVLGIPLAAWLASRLAPVPPPADTRTS